MISAVYNVVESLRQANRRRRARRIHKRITQGDASDAEHRLRFFDHVLDIYVLIGAYIGVALSAVVAALVCVFCYNVFFTEPHGTLFLCMAGLATFVGAASLAVCTFFSSSVLWFPILLILASSAPALSPVFAWLSQLHH